MTREEKKMNKLVRLSPLMIKDILKAHWRSVPKEPFNLTAEPSTVKSEGLHQGSVEIASEEQQYDSPSPREFFDWNRKSHEQKMEAFHNPGKYFVFADYRASETDIGEVRIQDIRAEEMHMSFKYNLLFATLSKPEAMGILFFDEMNLASNMIKAQFYKIINDHCVGDIPLSPNVLCCSAGNEAEHSRNVSEDPVPLVLRRANYFLRPLTADEYLDYAMRSGQHELVIGYLGFQKDDVHKIEYDLPDGVGQPCPRTWTKLSNVLRANKRLTPQQMGIFASGFVGPAVGTKFEAFAALANKVDLDAILKQPKLIKQYENDKDAISILYAVVSGIAARFREERKTIVPAVEVALELDRSELGAFLCRSMRESVGQDAFIKAGEKIPDALMAKFIERYAKFLDRKTR